MLCVTLVAVVGLFAMACCRRVPIAKIGELFASKPFLPTHNTHNTFVGFCLQAPSGQVPQTGSSLSIQPVGYVVCADALQ